MARKDPFKRISVSDRILEALEKKRQEEHRRDYKIPPMNAYCEKILWDYATGKLIRAGSIPTGSAAEGEGQEVTGISGAWQEPDQSGGEVRREQKHRKRGNK